MPFPAESVFLPDLIENSSATMPRQAFPFGTSGPQVIYGVPSAGLQLMDTTWPLNIPPPDLLYHLVETFFNSAPFANILIHRPTFMTNLLQFPSAPDFP